MATRIVKKKSSIDYIDKNIINQNKNVIAKRSKWKTKFIGACIFVGIGVIGSMLQFTFIHNNPNMKDSFLMSGIEPLPTIHPDTKEADKLREENRQLKELVSRGESQRKLNEMEKRKVVGAINNRLKDGLLANKGEIYFEAGKLYNIEPQLLAAISVNETTAETKRGNGNWKAGMSQVLRDCNNVGGLNFYEGCTILKDGKLISVKAKGRYIVYPSIDDSIYDMARRLRMFYYDKGLNTIPLIGNRYAPLDDYQNGKYGMNNHTWVSTVTSVYNELKEASK